MSTVICTDRDGKTIEVDRDQLAERKSAYGVIFKDDHALLVHDNYGYDVPGGGVDDGETFEEGLVREIREETGLIVTVGEHIAERECFYWSHRTLDKPYRHTIAHYYRCEVTGGTFGDIHIEDYEQEVNLKPLWLPIKDLDSIRWGHTIPAGEIVKKALQD